MARTHAYLKNFVSSISNTCSFRRVSHSAAMQTMLTPIAVMPEKSLRSMGAVSILVTNPTALSRSGALNMIHPNVTDMKVSKVFLIFFPNKMAGVNSKAW